MVDKQSKNEDSYDKNSINGYNPYIFPVPEHLSKITDFDMKHKNSGFGHLISESLSEAQVFQPVLLKPAINIIKL
jgi:hypothetical protein